MNDQYLLAVFIAGTVLITIFAVMMTVFLVINKQKQNRDKLERQQLEHTYHSNLMRTRIDMQEQALHYVSQEIHDNMGQVLSFSCLQLANLKWAIPNETARASLIENLDVIRNAVKELRMLSHSLNTNRVEKRQLEEIIESELNRIRSFSPIKCYLEVKGHVSSLSPETRLLIFRILQEALQNVVKHADAKSVNISIGYDERHFNMTVKDDGKGINMEALKDSGSLGMGNMEERAKLMGGTVTVHSDGHSGTEISLDIPIIKIYTPMQETTSLKKPVRIAIADDHMMFRMGLAALLRNAGERFDIVAEAGDGQELVNMLAKLETPPQVCLVDVNMPVMDGYKTLAYLRMKYRDMKFLSLSMYDHEFAIIKMLRQGANGYLLKEDDPEVLMQAIEHVVDNDFYHSDLTNKHLAELQGEEAHKRLELSANEKMFLELCCTEMIYKEIATAMGLSVRTIEGYRDDLFQKVGVNTRTGLVIYAMKHGLVNL